MRSIILASSLRVVIIFFLLSVGCSSDKSSLFKQTFDLGGTVSAPAEPTTPGTLAVVYDGNGHTGGTVPIDNLSPYTNGTTVTVLSNLGALAKTGYTFAGWNTASDGSGTAYAPAATFIVSNQTTLYARWTPASSSTTYTVTYNGNGHTGGTVPTDPSSPYNSGSPVSVFTNMGSLTKTGATFVGWNTAADGTGTNYNPLASFIMPAANVILYARWATGLAVIYNGNGSTAGAVPPVDVYAAGATVTVAANTGGLARGGYVFAGWNTTAAGDGTNRAPNSTFSMSNTNLTLFAKWTLLPTYTVTYAGNGHDSGSVPIDSATYWESAVVPVATNSGGLAKTGYSFAGWSIAIGNSTHAVSETFYMPSSNVTLEAQWIVNGSYGVTYNGNGHTGGTVPVDAGSPFVSGLSVTVLGNSGNLVRGTDTFIGWNTSANGTGTDYSAGDIFNITAHTFLYARWTPRYTVSFNANGGTGTMAAKAIAAETSANLPASTLTRENHIFAGWATTPNGPVVYNDRQSYRMGSADAVLYAKWMSTSSLKINYNFNSQNAADVSGNNAHGTPQNVSYVLDGVGNYAVKLNGTSSYIAVPQYTVTSNPQFTVMMRFKATPSQHGSLFGYQNGPVGTSAALHVPMIVVRSDGRLRGELWKTSEAEMEVISSSAVNDGMWHTVYFSSDGSTIKLFLDGLLLGQATDSVNHLTMYYNQIGTSRASGRVLMPNVSPTANNWYYFNGLIDDFFFYNTAL